MANAVDFSFVSDANTVNILKQNGVTHVGRYLSYTSWKGLSVSEVATVKAAGLDIISIYETDPTHSSYFTAAQGKADALAAIALAKKVGQPANTAIYFTVDFDCPSTVFGAVDEYFLAVKENLAGYKVGAYGSYSVIGHLKTTGHVDYYFQTLAWSGGKRQSFIHIYQSQCDTKVGTLPVDIDILEQADVGAWGTPNPVSKPSPTSVPVKRNGKLQVIVKDLNVRNIPSTNGSVVRQVQAGDELDFYYTQDGWYCISTAQNEWVYSANSTYTKEIASAPVATPAPAPKPAAVVTTPAPAPKPVVPVKNGWIKENNIWHYYENGVMAKSKWVKYTDGHWYFLKDNGDMAVSQWEQWKNVWYYLKANGAMAESEWIKHTDGKWYYLQADGSMATDKVIPSSGKFYYVDKTGAMAVNTTVTVSVKVGADGSFTA